MKRPVFRAEKIANLEGEIQTAADHGEIILRAVDDAPADIIGPANVTGESDFETESKMTQDFCVSVEMVTLCVDGWEFVRQTGNRLGGDGIALPAPKDRTDTGPTVR